MIKTKKELQPYIKKAKKAGACASTINFLSSHVKDKDVKDLIHHCDAPDWAYWYCQNVSGRPDKKLEPYIFTDAQYAYQYCFDVLKEPSKEAEKIIFTSPQYAYLYCFDVLNKPSKTAEKIIFTQPNSVSYTHLTLPTIYSV